MILASKPYGERALLGGGCAPEATFTLAAFQPVCDLTMVRDGDRYSRHAADMAEKAANKADGLALDDDVTASVRGSASMRGGVGLRSGPLSRVC